MACGKACNTAHSGVPFVSAPNPLFVPLCLAVLYTGIPLVRPLPVTLTLTLACKTARHREHDSRRRTRAASLQPE
eukprot:352886-Chlamydomonas_euryale.AAC.4